MNNYSIISCGINTGVNHGATHGVMSGVNHVNHHTMLHGEHYATMDLCSQAQMSDDDNNILNRMDKLRAFAREQQAKRVKTQRQQTSFCF